MFRKTRLPEVVDFQNFVKIVSQLEVAVDRLDRVVAVLEPLIEQVVEPGPTFPEGLG